MSRTIFFNWQGFEEFICYKYKINFPEGIKFLSEDFSVEAAKSANVISIFTDSRISNLHLRILKEQGLKKIILRSAGCDMLDVDYAKSLGIEVNRVASYSPESIAEFAITLMLSLARKLMIQRKEHERLDNVRQTAEMGFLLRGKTLGLHGYGKIGKEVANIARDGLKMNVQFYDPYIKERQKDPCTECLEDLYATSDIVSIHVPLTKETEGIVDKSILENVRPRFMLINTSRGRIINSNDVKELLEYGKIDYLGVDVWNIDDSFDPELFRYNTIQTDHVAFFTEEAVKAILEQTLENLVGKTREENRL